MKKAVLYRQDESDQGTLGLLCCDGLYWHSLELPDRQNKSNISRIPNGEYIAKVRYSPSFKKEYYCLQNVKGRSYILIHGANFAGDTKKGFQTHLQGCIALGKKAGAANNKYKKTQKCIFNSQQAIREFMQYMEKKEFKLIIKDML